MHRYTQPGKNGKLPTWAETRYLHKVQRIQARGGGKWQGQAFNNVGYGGSVAKLLMGEI